MGRTAKDNRDLPHPRPVQKIELSGDDTKRRLAAAVLLLLVGAAALAYAVFNLLTPGTGWQAIEAAASLGPTCGDEFVFLYDLGSGGMPLRAEGRAVADLYTQSCRKAFQLFHTVESFEGIVNLRDISLHPNETLTVDGGLYRALETVQRHGDRTIYLGPVYERYWDIFLCEDDAELVDFDPWFSGDVAREYAGYAAYARDPQAVDLELLGEGRVCLRVSEDYLAYARQTGITCFLDFGWLKNAFIADYLADVMIENGYVRGSISSRDGFSRNLDGRGGSYSLNVYDLVDGSVVPAAVMEYRGPMSIVCLRDYPLGVQDGQRFYRLKNGEVRTSYLSPADGKCRSAAHDLICYSRSAGCGEAALEIAPIYIADTLDTHALGELAERGFQSVYCREQTAGGAEGGLTPTFRGRVVCGTDPGLTLTRLYDSEGMRYTAALGR